MCLCVSACVHVHARVCEGGAREILALVGRTSHGGGRYPGVNHTLALGLPGCSVHWTVG